MTSYPLCTRLLITLVVLQRGLGNEISETNGSMSSIQGGIMKMALQMPEVEKSTSPTFSEHNLTTETMHSPMVNIIDQGSVSREQYETIKLVFDIILKPLVCLVGLVLNVIGICVLLQPQLRHGFYIYLATLSIADSGYLLCGLIRSSVKIYSSYNPVAALEVQDGIIAYIDWFIEIPLCKLGAYSIILFSVDRLFAVVRPLKAKHFFLSRYSKYVCISLAVFVFIFYIPKGTELGRRTVFDPDLNMTRTVLRRMKREPGTSMASFISAYNITNDIIFMYLPPVLLCLVNLLLIIQIRRVRQSRKRLFSGNPKISKSQMDQQKLVITVFVISAFFLAVYIPMIFARNWSAKHPEFRPFKREHYLTQIIPILVSFGWSINAAIDFTVYLATSERFRQTLRATCCKRRLKSKSKLITSPVVSRSWTIISSISSSSISQPDDNKWSESGSSKVELTTRYEATSGSSKPVFVVPESTA